MIIKAEEYILLSKTERQKHLKLDEACDERGCNSEQARGLLAYILSTSVPSGMKIHACHACNNDKCINPYHLYWGTPAENRADAIACGRASTKSIWQKSVNKYGLEEAKRRAILRIQPYCELRKSIREAQLDKRYVGTHNSGYGKCWIKKDEKEQRISNENVKQFLTDGWEKGRAKSSISHLNLPMNRILRS